ncbi:hypothetical protein WH240_13260 [Gluconobacter wancherniae]
MIPDKIRFCVIFYQSLHHAKAELHRTKHASGATRIAQTRHWLFNIKEATLLDDPFTEQFSKPGFFRTLQLAALLDFSANGEDALRRSAGVFD